MKYQVFSSEYDGELLIKEFNTVEEAETFITINEFGYSYYIL